LPLRPTCQGIQFLKGYLLVALEQHFDPMLFGKHEFQNEMTFRKLYTLALHILMQVYKAQTPSNYTEVESELSRALAQRASQRPVQCDVQRFLQNTPIGKNVEQKSHGFDLWRPVLFLGTNPLVRLHVTSSTKFPVHFMGLA
jgi:hypothetical protein